MRLLVTGASGFVGRPTLRRLVERKLAGEDHGLDVHAVTRGPALPGPLASVVCHAVDLLEPAARAALVERVRPTHLLHLAWEATPGSYWTSPLNAAWLAASLDLVDRALALGCRRVVAAGTCAEYAWGDDAPLDEATAPLAPATPYGQAKDALRAALAVRCPAAGASWAWGRIFFAYGPGEPAGRLVPSVARALLAGQEAKASEGRQARDFVHVDDVAAAFAALVDHDLVGPVNLATGVATPVRDLVLTLGRLTGRPELVRLGAVPVRPGEPPVVLARVDRLVQELGLRPSFDLEAGLADTLARLRGL